MSLPRPAQSASAPGTGARILSSGERLYRQLREEILNLHRPPGAQIIEKEIALEAGVSRTPVREALLRLANEGLVDIAAKSGTYVSLIPVSALHEAIIARSAIEEAAARMAAARRSQSQMLALKATIARQKEATAAGDTLAFHRADEAFHAAIADASGYPGLWRLVLDIKVQVDRYRHLSLSMSGRMKEIIGEHDAIATAIAARDEAAAMRAMAAHIGSVMVPVPQMVAQYPHYFVDLKP